MKVRDVVRLLEADGWYLARTRGSHHQYKHPVKPGLVTVPGSGGDDLDLERVAVLPAKADSPLIVDADAVLPGPIAAELL